MRRFVHCKLCDNVSVSLWYEDKAREYFRCSKCGLVFVPEPFVLSVKHERKRYELHDNTLASSGYVNYLNQIVLYVINRSEQSSSIVDFGSGKNKVLGTLLHEKGFSCDSYDPCFDIDEIVSDKKYDVVIMCEVIEHLRSLNSELDFINSLMMSDGYVVLRTQLYNDREMFTSWWYKEDLTHLNYFCRSTVDFVATILCCSVIQTAYKDIFILSKCTDVTHVIHYDPGV